MSVTHPCSEQKLFNITECQLQIREFHFWLLPNVLTYLIYVLIVLLLVCANSYISMCTSIHWIKLLLVLPSPNLYYTKMFISPTPNKYLLVLFAQKSPYHTTPHCIAKSTTMNHSTPHIHTPAYTHTSQKRKEQNVMELMLCNVL